MTFQSLLTQLCSIYRKTTTVSEQRFTDSTWALVAENVNCRIDYMFVTSSYISQTPNGQITGNDYVGYFAAGTDIQAGDRILWQGNYLYARPVNPIFAAGNAIHHLEVMFGLQES